MEAGSDGRAALSAEQFCRKGEDRVCVSVWGTRERGGRREWRASGGQTEGQIDSGGRTVRWREILQQTVTDSVPTYDSS